MRAVGSVPPSYNQDSNGGRNTIALYISVCTIMRACQTVVSRGSLGSFGKQGVRVARADTHPARAGNHALPGTIASPSHHKDGSS